MSLHFHPVKVKDIRRETNDCVSISFDIPAQLQETFAYTQGQYITLRTHINGEEVRRSYSVCSSPLDHELRIAVKQVAHGTFSTYANEELRKGDTLEAMPPMGKFFTPLSPANSKNYTGFAAGSGITPLLSIIKTTLRTEPGSSFTLVYGNRNRHSIIFKEELEALKNKYMSRFRVIYILSREKTDAAIHFGRIDAEKCSALCEKNIDLRSTDDFFLCGPEEMIFSVKAQLEQLGVDSKKIHFELFTAPDQKKATVAASDKSGRPDASSNITIRLDGVSFGFELPFEGPSILDAALKNGADLPYACKGGVCCTCRAKLVEGEVDMDVNYGLEQEEIEQGFVLTCQSHPRTERVVLDFDAK
ncbi:1,2-phenylacetyl-CoA epoxidase subunit PaaE [Sediminibacterium ginsengisoli]|uniref:Ring-1,2-phenylacetyl-CoA epoxidase subunit PaaE n=1 Tax=Sediminibacterium ginsengisoli TaxID=413434 RepID=A0A1T4JSN5_9BACT|nr:1,2-phenylacetyl-CoA epoxidase subunit PaaE [Sediminibacterium ginsengisoli]SJZ33151.1 ring-1,2-phenylacetyl-CoA epoxidase subunit PaaE [Sediminibacterium ginsengisoli]